ncbi:MAG: FAD-dependent oxidoreductase, partial [Anaerolineales bacterium]
MLRTEVLIVGSGVAGAVTALRLARNPNRQITLITRAADPHESNSRYAQGGIVGRNQEDDSEALYQDILAAGAGASNPEAVRLLVDEGPPLVDEILIETAKVAFDQDAKGQLHYGQEGAHSRRR